MGASTKPHPGLLKELCWQNTSYRGSPVVDVEVKTARYKKSLMMKMVLMMIMRILLMTKYQNHNAK